METKLGSPTSPTTVDYPRGIFGHRTGMFDTGWPGWDIFETQMGGQIIEMMGGLEYFLHTDAVGSTTMDTDNTGTVHWDVTRYPWGQYWNVSGSQSFDNFAGLGHGVLAGAYPARLREYNVNWGRWLTPDPAGLAAANPSNPQSWNRYAYVLNNPATLNDPLGLIEHVPEGCTVDSSGFWLDCGIFMTPEACSQSFVGFCGNGEGDAHGGGGGSAPVGGSVPSYSQVLKSFNNCAANYADKHSVASLLHVNDTLVGNMLFGSTTAAVSNLFFQSEPKVYMPAGASLAAGARAGTAIKIGAAIAGKVPTGGTVYASTGTIAATPYGPALEMGRTGEALADTAVGKTALSGARGAAGLLEIAAPALILYDELMYGIGEGACTARAF